MATKTKPQHSNIHEELFGRLVDWAKKPAPRDPAAVFLYGPPGIGKTTLAHAALKEAGYRVVEWNASQHRHRTAVEESLYPLLESQNVSDYFRPEGPRNLGIVLDEIDGMSVGDKGGLSELITILRNYKGNNAIICISNEWQEKKYLPYLRWCLSMEVAVPTSDEVFRLVSSYCSELGDAKCSTITTLVQRLHGGDLRKITQTLVDVSKDLISGKITLDDFEKMVIDGINESHAITSNRVNYSQTIKIAIGKLFRGEMDILDDITLNNNDLNLAGLHLHESLPKWIKRHYGSQSISYKMYFKMMNSILISDRIDYYTFFFQHWTLFPITYQSKLQSINIGLFEEFGKPKTITWADDDMEYTAVLSKQSWLYNQFRYMCELRDTWIAKYKDYRGGLEGMFWIANLANLWCSIEEMNRFGGPSTPLAPSAPPAKKTAKKYTKEENLIINEYRAKYLPESDPVRFQRCVNSLVIPKVPPI